MVRRSVERLLDRLLDRLRRRVGAATRGVTPLRVTRGGWAALLGRARQRSAAGAGVRGRAPSIALDVAIDASFALLARVAVGISRCIDPDGMK